jgi:hypothetical protein
MKESGYYPAGAEFDPRAPWNEVELPPKDIEVTISAIVSKTIKVPVRDYTIDEEGNIDFSECDLKKAVEENIRLPNINGWNLDNFEVVLE